ncbi:MAG: hypothetical protein V3V55_03330 [Rhodospirillales bacterium]
MTTAKKAAEAAKIVETKPVLFMISSSPAAQEIRKIAVMQFPKSQFMDDFIEKSPPAESQRLMTVNGGLCYRRHANIIWNARIDPYRRRQNAFGHFR